MTAKLAGINDVTLEVADVDAALEWHGQPFSFELRGGRATRTARAGARRWAV